MFYEGDLQSGIAKAVQEAKLVACFVADNGDESRLWENDFLQDPTVKSSLSEQAIVLRLEAGSTEAGYLAAIYPLPKTPTFVVIKNGELKEYIAAGVLKDDFLNRIKTVIGSNTPSTQATSTTSQVAQDVVPAQQDTSTALNSNPPPSSSNPSNTRVQAHLAERSARLEVQRREQEARDKAKRAAEAEARKKKSEEASSSNSASSADMKYALMQKKRQQEARDERARILKRVEDDKAARRVRAAEQKAQTQAQAKVNPPTSESGPSNVNPPSKKYSAECALQIRLFDGSTIRSRFPSTATLSKDVRSWVDKKQEGDQPYTFKQVLSPLPNKNIETSEEERTLDSLDLAPSATLILLPVASYSSAYTTGGSIISPIVGIVSSGIAIAGRALGGIFGGGAAAATPATPAQESQESGSPPTQSTGINVRTLRHRDSRDNQQFYNGNATNFEPRRDDYDSKDD